MISVLAIRSKSKSLSRKATFVEGWEVGGKVSCHYNLYTADLSPLERSGK